MQTTISFTTQRNPYCPTCGTPLNPTCVHFLHDTAFCTYCVYHQEPTDLIRAAVELIHPRHARDRSDTLGLYWYTPHFMPRQTLLMTALMNAEQLRCGHDANETTPE